MDLVMVVAFLQPSYPFGRVPSPPKIGGILPVKSSRSWHRPVFGDFCRPYGLEQLISAKIRPCLWGRQVPDTSGFPNRKFRLELNILHLTYSFLESVESQSQERNLVRRPLFRRLVGGLIF